MKKSTFFYAVLILFVISQVVHMVDGFLGMQFYTDPQYFGVWSKVMMPIAGPPPVSFFYYAGAFNLLSALIFVGIYGLIKAGISGATTTAKGVQYGFLMFLLSGLTASMAMWLFFNIPLALIGMWTVEDLVIKLVGGITTARLLK